MYTNYGDQLKYLIKHCNYNLERLRNCLAKKYSSETL